MGVQFLYDNFVSDRIWALLLMILVLSVFCVVFLGFYPSYIPRGFVLFCFSQSLHGMMHRLFVSTLFLVLLKQCLIRFYVLLVLKQNLFFLFFFLFAILWTFWRKVTLTVGTGITNLKQEFYFTIIHTCFFNLF